MKECILEVGLDHVPVAEGVFAELIGENVSALSNTVCRH